LVLRAFSSGAVALTGVQTIATGVPLFKEPKPRNAARSLAMLALVCVALLLGVLALAQQMQVRFVADPATELLYPDGRPVGPEFHLAPVLAQMTQAVYSGLPWLSDLVIVLVGALLFLAASTVFRSVPALTALLAREEYLPKQFYRRSDRGVTAHGIVALALGALVLILVFDAQVTKLIQLYIVGVFISFTLSQLGMIRHWNARLPLVKTARERRRMLWSRSVNVVGFVLTAATLVVVIATKLTHGAWVTLILVCLLVAGMSAIKRHYGRVDQEILMQANDPSVRALPSRVHAIVLVSALNRSAARAVAYARATRPATLGALSVVIDPARTARLRADWDRYAIPVKLRLLDAPSRELTRPVIEYIRSIRRRSPRDLIVLYLPQKVVGHWWELALHNRSASRLTAKLRRLPGVVVSCVPWQLDSAAADQ
jgi:hypothetical protein